MNKLIMDYPNLESFIEDVSTGDHKRQASVKRFSGQTPWGGSTTFEKGVDVARNGVDLGRVDSLVNATESLHHVITNTVHDVTGAVVDIGAYMTGEPECMIDFVQEDNNRYVVINVDVVESDGTDERVFTNKAVACASIVDELESKGIRVRLNAICMVNMAGRLMCPIVRIKDFTERLSLAQLTGAVSKAFFRRLCLAWLEKYQVAPWKHNYGRSSTEYDSIQLDGVVMKNSRAGMPLFSEHDVKKYAESYLKSIAI
jgi:hypothetical protein